MLSIERPAFDAHFRALVAGCTGWSQPPEDALAEAYWRGLQSMGLISFERLVDSVLSGAANAELGVKGRGRIPTVTQLWSIHHQLRHQRREDTARDQRMAMDEFDRFGNVLLLNFLRRHPQPIANASIRPMVAEKDRLIAIYRELAAEDGITDDDGRERLAAKLRADLHASWNELAQPASEQELRADREYLERHGHVRDHWNDHQEALP